MDKRTGISLRDADWRLLLPRPPAGVFEALALPGGRTELAERLVRDGIARRVEVGGFERGGWADAVVVLVDARPHISIEEAIRLLAPGGAIYYEVDRKLHGALLTANRAARALRARGVTPTGSYWVRPNFEQRQTYIPLDVRGPLAWYLHSSFSTPGKARVLGAAMRALVKVSQPAATSLARRYAVTGVLGTATESIACALARRSLRGITPGRDLSIVMNANGWEEIRRLVLLPFVAGRAYPVAVLKSSRLPRLNYLSEVEQRALDSLRASLDGPMRDSIPAPLGITKWDEIAVGAETYVTGTVMTSVCRPRMVTMARKIAAFHRAADWLTEFNYQAQARRGTWTPADRIEYLDPWITLYRSAYGLTEGEQSLLRRLDERLEAAVGTQVPIVWLHLDYSPWNICTSGGRIRVFDWEGAVPGIPIYDLLYFAVRWYNEVMRLPGADPPAEAFRVLYCGGPGRREFVPMVEEAVARYVERLGLDPAFATVGLTGVAFSRAVGRLHRVPPEQRVNLDRANPRLAMVRLMVEHQNSIFGEAPRRVEPVRAAPAEIALK